MIHPKLPDYDIARWRTRPFPERLRMVCRSWAEDGYGTPVAIYGLYALKIVAYVAAWLWFCTFSEGQPLSEVDRWWASDDAFAKAILWTMWFEGLGLGCGSGPLTGRYVPPVGGALYFLRPGTTKLPLLTWIPWLGGHRRTIVDVALYAATSAALLVALTAPQVQLHHLIPLLVLLPVMGCLDKTLFLVHRSEHYLSVVVCLCFAGDWVPGAQFVWVAIWWWAATSKLNHHFPAVMGVMTSNAPFTRGTPLRRWVYRDFPDDLRPSRFAAALAHTGTAAEYLLPAALLLSHGGPLTPAWLIALTAFHLFILCNVPMGVPLEWNVVMIYGAWVLFGAHAGVDPLDVGAAPLWAWLIGFHVALPLFGSLYPRHVSFLLSMRYYAGNWPYSLWLFRGDALRRLDQIPKWSPDVRDQLGLLYDEDTITALMSKVLAFRAMHLQGRALRALLPRAVDDLEDYTLVDGEIVAGMVVGWNFGDGHLSNEQLLRAVQAQCGFEPGALRCVFVESQPLHRGTVAWRIADAHAGPLDAGTLTIASLQEGQPWAVDERPRGAPPPPG